MLKGINMATVNIIDVWGAYTTTNEYEALGECLGWFSIKRDAELAASKRGWYGGDGHVKHAKAISVTYGPGNQYVYVLEDPHPIDLDGTRAKVRETIKVKALQKLTKEEIDALGL